MYRSRIHYPILYAGLLFILLLLHAPKGRAQFWHKKTKELKLPKPEAPNRQYIADYHKELTTRLFGSRKYNSFGLQDKGYLQNIQYRPNSPFNVGIGVNYRIIGLNLGFNLPAINNNTLNGKTKFLDLQSHLYGRKLIIDIYLQRYKGFYLPNASLLANNNNNEVYIRPDLLTLNFGTTVHYLTNGKKFSFRGAFLQNEVQLKSAGSPIVGAAISHVRIQADSSIIPAHIRYADYFNNEHFKQSNVSSLSANFGYGYTFVLPYHLFITAAGSGGLGINYTRLATQNSGKISGMGTALTATFRLSFGYNSRRYFAGIHYAGTRSTSSTPILYARQQFGAGNLRISFAKRFTLRKKLLGIY